MSLSSAQKVPSKDVGDLLYEYFSRRHTFECIAKTKQNPISPLDRLCADLLKLQAIVEEYRDGLIRETTTHVPPAKSLASDVTICLGDLLAPGANPSLSSDAGQRFIDEWKHRFARFRCTTYAELNVNQTDNTVEIPIRDVAKLSAIALALKDEAERAKRSIQNMVRIHSENDNDGTVKDRATAWLLREWPKRCPRLSLRALARWISEFRIEDGPPDKIEDRLRKAQKRRKRGTPNKEMRSASGGRQKRRVVQRPPDAATANISRVPRTP